MQGITNILESVLTAKKEKNEKFEILKEDINDLFEKYGEFFEDILYDKKAKILNELNEIISFSLLKDKNIIAIGGGFSSGKSSFINSLLEDGDLKLNVSITPETAIPTYVLNEKSRFVKFYTKFGCSKIVNDEFLKYLSHNNLAFFNIAKILNHIIIKVKYKYDYLNNICFIDTPGYNSPNIQTMIEDESNSDKFLKHASGIIWVIGIESNGTISAKDLEKLAAVSDQGKKIYIILNKADLKPDKIIEEIIEEIEDELNLNSIEYEGIQAYSSTIYKNYKYSKKSLVEFLKEENKKVNRFDGVINSLDEIFINYEDKLAEKIKKIEAEIETIDDFIFKLSDLNEFIENEISQEEINEYNQLFESTSTYLNKVSKSKKEEKIDEYIKKFEEVEIENEKIKETLNNLKNINFDIVKETLKINDKISQKLSEFLFIIKKFFYKQEKSEFDEISIGGLSKLLKESNLNDFEIQKNIKDIFEREEYLKKLNFNYFPLINILNFYFKEIDNIYSRRVLLTFKSNLNKNNIKEEIFKLPIFEYDGAIQYSYNQKYDFVIFNHESEKIIFSEKEFKELFDLINLYKDFFKDILKEINIKRYDEEFKNIVFVENSLEYLDAEIVIDERINVETLNSKNVYIILTKELNEYNLNNEYIKGISYYENGNLILKSGKSLNEFLNTIAIDRASQIVDLINEIFEKAKQNLKQDSDVNMFNKIKEINLFLIKKAIENEYSESINQISLKLKKEKNNLETETILNRLSKIQKEIIELIIREFESNEKLSKITEKIKYIMN